jgi:phosphoadenosine phosphosulfate reductase
MHRPFLGRIQIYWCDRCHVPVLSDVCACGSATREVPLTPPGDARPAFPADIDRVNRIYREHFGSEIIPKGHLALLNKVPDDDRMEEIVVGGAVIGAIRYRVADGRWEPIPRLPALRLMQPERRYVIADDGAVPSILQGSSLLAPGLVAIDDAISAGDEVCIYGKSGAAAGVGRAKVGAAEARLMTHGAVVRTRKNTPSIYVPGEATWERAVEANAHILSLFEEKAIGFIRSVAEENPLPATVSYSGGKDSLATLLVVLKAIGKVPLIFADSGLEFPETCRNVQDIKEQFGLEVVTAHHGGRFWEIFDRDGPPAVNARWCCAACKLHPVNEAIRERWGECLSFIGQRKYESAKRMASKRIWRNPKVQNQLAAAPIHQWTALHVWLYLFREHARYNPLYARGFDRIGCFMCPSSDMAVIQLIEETHPDLWRAWWESLEGYRERRGLPAEWSKTGLWRKAGADTHE